MGPVNATVRFVAELVAVYGIAAGTWAVSGSVVLTAVVPVAAMTAWAVFRVPDDPGPAPVAVTGVVRLTIEAAVFVAAALGLWATHRPIIGVIFASAVVVHYTTSPERLRHVLFGPDRGARH